MCSLARWTSFKKALLMLLFLTNKIIIKIILWECKTFKGHCSVTISDPFVSQQELHSPTLKISTCAPSTLHITQNTEQVKEVMD
jgi:hypothetical protein